jgi:hypothetical protein
MFLPTLSPDYGIQFSLLSFSEINGLYSTDERNTFEPKASLSDDNFTVRLVTRGCAECVTCQLLSEIHPVRLLMTQMNVAGLHPECLPSSRMENVGVSSRSSRPPKALRLAPHAPARSALRHFSSY